VALSDSSSIDLAGTTGRKADHIRINLDEDVSAKGVTSGFENYRFVHCALPEIDLDEVDIGTELFGRRLEMPVFISCMTGGVPEAERINMTLAQVASEFGMALGLGSARVLLEHPEVLPSFDVRRYAPGALIFANLGAVQLNRGIGVDQCRRLIDLIKADALVLHLNALQEALQPEGDTTFAGLLRKISLLTDELEVPVIVKEVGWGISPDLVARLFEAGVAAVDVAGAGGTSWSEVERHRMDGDVRRRVAAAFSDWGLPTAEAVRQARRVAPDSVIFASGGIRSGIDAAKALALGADMVGVAGPFLRAASQGPDAARDLAEEFAEVLRTVMFCVAAPNVAALQVSPRLQADGAGSMGMYRAGLRYSTEGAGQFIDITEDVASQVDRSGIRNGLVQIFSSHTTAAIRINEHEPLLLADFRRLLDRIAPPGQYEHDELERRVNVPPDEPLNARAHCQHLLMSTSESLPVVEGRMSLGTWQRIFLVELCSSRQRQVTVQVLGT
jgi:isopentenyl-diphosphate Delta-isomerase